MAWLMMFVLMLSSDIMEGPSAFMIAKHHEVLSMEGATKLVTYVIEDTRYQSSSQIPQILPSIHSAIHQQHGRDTRRLQVLPKVTQKLVALQ